MDKDGKRSGLRWVIIRIFLTEMHKWDEIANKTYEKRLKEIHMGIPKIDRHIA